MVMRQTYEIYPWQIMEVDGRVGLTGSSDSRPEMDMVSGVEEILYTYVTDAQMSFLLSSKQEKGVERG